MKDFRQNSIKSNENYEQQTKKLIEVLEQPPNYSEFNSEIKVLMQDLNENFSIDNNAELLKEHESVLRTKNRLAISKNLESKGSYNKYQVDEPEDIFIYSPINYDKARKMKKMRGSCITPDENHNFFIKRKEIEKNRKNRQTKSFSIKKSKDEQNERYRTLVQNFSKRGSVFSRLHDYDTLLKNQTRHEKKRKLLKNKNRYFKVEKNWQLMKNSSIWNS